MTEQPNMGLTWEGRLTLGLPGPPLAGAFIVVASLIVVYLGFEWLFGLQVYRLTIILLLLATYALMCPRFFALSEALERKGYGIEIPVSGDREMEVWIRSYRHEKIRRSRLAGTAGVVMFFWLNTMIAALQGADPLTVWFRLHEGTFTMAIVMFLGWLLGRGVYLEFSSPPVLPSPDPSEVDLLNLEQLYAAGRSGLRGALLWFVCMSIGSLLYLDSVGGLPGGVLFLLLGLVIGLVVLLRPARRIRRLIRDAKGAELTRLELLLRQAHDDAVKGEVSTQGRLTYLLSYQERVRSTREWPCDSSTFLHFGLYLLIPVGSMIGGALVERIIDALLA